MHIEGKLVGCDICGSKFKDNSTLKKRHAYSCWRKTLFPCNIFELKFSKTWSSIWNNIRNKNPVLSVDCDFGVAIFLNTLEVDWCHHKKKNGMVFRGTVFADWHSFAIMRLVRIKNIEFFKSRFRRGGHLHNIGIQVFSKNWQFKIWISE